MSLNQLVAIIAVILVLFDNQAFLKAVFTLANQSVGLSGLGFKIAIATALWALFAFLLSFAANRWLFKPFAAIILITAAVISFFMDHYRIVVDKAMIQNVFETDYQETVELISGKLLLHTLVLGLLPAWGLCCITPSRKLFFRELLNRIGFMVLVASVFFVSFFAYYKELSFLDRNNKHLRYLINPNHAIYSLVKYLKSGTNPEKNLQALGTDAKQLVSWQERGKKSLLVIVVGETARAQNFSLNGYPRQTNPKLAQEDIINFPNTTSCGTSTAASLPCMFSHLGHAAYEDDKAKSTENLLDVLVHAGIDVWWMDNNSGCKGVCDRVPNTALEHMKLPGFCGNGECFDEVLLHGLQGVVDKLPRDSVIVLHQKGSHGPAYYKRYPKEFQRFTPECATNQVQDCPQEQIVNAYDNTIAYTDHVLSKLIHFLQKNSKLNTAMMYMSDHGESLGENGIYLHGLPYLLAPVGQKHIPFVVWLSDGFADSVGLDKACLKQQAARYYSHDNLFHSVLGLMSVQTAVHDKNLDIFSACR